MQKQKKRRKKEKKKSKKRNNPAQSDQRHNNLSTIRSERERSRDPNQIGEREVALPRVARPRSAWDHGWVGFKSAWVASTWVDGLRS